MKRLRGMRRLDRWSTGWVSCGCEGQHLYNGYALHRWLLHPWKFLPTVRHGGCEEDQGIGWHCGCEDKLRRVWHGEHEAPLKGKNFCISGFWLSLSLFPSCRVWLLWRLLWFPLALWGTRWRRLRKLDLSNKFLNVYFPNYFMLLSLFLCFKLRKIETIQSVMLLDLKWLKFCYVHMTI